MYEVRGRDHARARHAPIPPARSPVFESFSRQVLEWMSTSKVSREGVRYHLAKIKPIRTSDNNAKLACHIYLADATPSEDSGESSSFSVTQPSGEMFGDESAP